MGNYHSGWYRDRKQTTLNYPRIAISDLRDQGALDDARELLFAVPGHEERICVQTDPDNNCLWVSTVGQKMKPLCVSLERCRAGKNKASFGAVKYFRCPRCGNRVQHMYLSCSEEKVILGCRKCFNLSYRTSQLSRNWSNYYAQQMFLLQDELGMEHCAYQLDYDHMLFGKPHDFSDEKWSRLCQKLERLLYRRESYFIEKGRPWLEAAQKHGKEIMKELRKIERLQKKEDLEREKASQ